MKSIHNFFNVLFAPGERVNIRVIHDTEKKAANSLHTFPSIPLAPVYPDSFPCVGINPRDGRKLSAIKNMVIDIDDAPLPAWAKKHADMICSRDDNHYHLYFCFSPSTRDDFKKYAKRVLNYTSGGDKTVSDPERVIRLPGFAHRKEGVEGPGYKVVYIRNEIKRLELAEKFKWLPKESEVAPVEMITPAMQKSSVKEYLKAIYKRKPIVTKGGGRSRELFFIGLDCHMWGVDLAEAIVLAGEISADRHEPSEDEKTIKHQVESAYKYATGEFGAALQAGTPAAQTKIKKQFEQIQRVREKMVGWVYVHAACRLINIESSISYTTRDQIEDFISCAVGSPVSFRQLLAGSALEVCDEIEFDPQNEKRIYERDGRKVFNSYRKNTGSVAREKRLKDSAVKTFEEHVKFITTSENEYEQLLNYFAYCVQNPGKKVDWTPLIISSSEGLGKSAFSVLFRKIFGEHNCSTVSAHKLLSGWTDFIAEKLFVTSHEVEINENAALTELKTLITESRVSVNAKYARTYETNNCANFLLLSNKIRPLKLDGNSRRFFVVVNKREPKDRKYYDKLFDAIENGTGWIMDYLLKRDLKNFDAHGAAPETKGLEILVESSKSDSTAWIEEQIANGSGAFESGFVELEAVARDAAIGADYRITKYLTRGVIASYLHGAGYEPREYWLAGRHKRCWFKGTDEEFETALEGLRASASVKAETEKNLI